MILARAALLWAALALPAAATGITSARFTEPTTRYTHGVLGDAVEYGALEIDMAGQASLVIRLPQDHVFEDVEPRLWDVTGDGLPEVVVVETDMSRGAALAVYGPAGKIAETPHIGSRNRWLAPVGAADLDGDGRIELAYVDRPHLARILRIWRLENGRLVELAEVAGITNHRIGEDFISGGIRDCGAGPEMVLATADWQDVVALRFDGTGFFQRKLGGFAGRRSFRAALDCR